MEAHRSSPFALAPGRRPRASITLSMQPRDFMMIRILICICIISNLYGFSPLAFWNRRPNRIFPLRFSTLSVNGEAHDGEVHQPEDKPYFPPMEISDYDNLLNLNLTATVAYGPETRLVLSSEGTALSADQLKVGDVVVEKLSPPMTFQKFLTMQEKRVNVTIRYSNVQGMRPFYLTVAKLIKSSHPDVVIEKDLIPAAGEDSEEELIFEVIIDGKVVVGKSRSTWQPVDSNGRKDLANGLSVFIPMYEINTQLAKARRRKRPTTTVYAQSVEADDGKTSVRLEMKKRGRYKK